MSARSTRLKLEAELSATGRQWEIIPGKLHSRILIDGRQVCVFSRDSESYPRGLKNLIGSIRRAGRDGYGQAH